MKVQQKYYDEIFNFKGQWDLPSKCGLKIKKINNQTVVIVTELYQENPGTSVTYASRLLAEQICKEKGLNLYEITYIECNPDTKSKLSFYDEECFQVTFDSENASPTANQYRKLNPEELKELFE